MEGGVTIFIIIALIIAIWVVVELKRMRHKIFALFLIALILFLYLTSTLVFKGQNIDFKSFSGMATATKLYFSWLGSAFEKVKLVTTNVIKMDWKTNSSIG